MKIGYYSLRFFFTILLAASVAVSSKECVYTLYVQTGNMLKAGTNARVNVTLGDSAGKSIGIPNLKNWGVMGQDHDYFERGSRDIFTGLGQCLGRPICRLNVTSDGSGALTGWYLKDIEVTSTGPHMGCSQSMFSVERWLSLNAPPFKLTAHIDICKSKLKYKKE